MSKGARAGVLSAAKVKAARVVSLRQARVPFDEIAEQLGYKDAESARAIYRRQIEKRIWLDVDELRAEMLDSLNGLWATYYPLAMAGDYKAADQCDKLAQRISKLCGLDMPTRSESNIAVTVSQDEFGDALREYVAGKMPEFQRERAAIETRLAIRQSDETRDVRTPRTNSVTGDETTGDD